MSSSNYYIFNHYLQAEKGLSDDEMIALKADDVICTPENALLEIRNLSVSTPILSVYVRTDSIYFDVGIISCNHADRQQHGACEHCRATRTVLVTPKKSIMASQLKRLLRDHYVQEHFTIYNQYRPFEMIRVVVSLQLGHLQSFHAFPRRPFQYTLGVLEGRIAALVVCI